MRSARANHNKNTAMNAQTKPVNGFWGNNTAGRNAATAMLHQGRNKPASQLSATVPINTAKNFMAD